MDATTRLPQATQAIRDRLIPPPPQLTDALIDQWRDRLRSDHRDLVPVGNPLRYHKVWNSQPLLWHEEALAEILDEFDPDTQVAVLGAEFFGEWYRAVGAPEPDGLPVYLTWVYEANAWTLDLRSQYMA